MHGNLSDFLNVKLLLIVDYGEDKWLWSSCTATDLSPIKIGVLGRKADFNENVFSIKYKGISLSYISLSTTPWQNVTVLGQLKNPLASIDQ